MTNTRPWTYRIYAASPANPIQTGFVFAGLLLLVFFLGRTFNEGVAVGSSNDLRIAVIHILLTAYAASAYAFLIMAARNTTHDLSPVTLNDPQWQAIVDQIGSHPHWSLILTGASYSLIFGVVTTNLTSLEGSNPWDWQAWNYDIWWQRITSVLFNWWSGCLYYVIIVESARISKLSESFVSLDLFNLSPYRPLIRQGLTNALLVIGLASLASLLLIESRYGPFLLGAWMVAAVFVGITLMLPLRGIRKKISAAKTQELDWCEQSLRPARDAMKSGAGAQQSIAEITAYRTIIENIRNWPFDSPTLVRFTLYLMIPLGSWLGGAFIERGLDLFLF